MKLPLTEYLDFARQVAFEAGRLTLGYFQAGVRADFKADDTPVTVADRRAEELIRAAIGRRYPSHRIVGEEFGAGDGKPDAPCWYIDPIDGTKSFIRGVPLYGVLLGLEVAGRVEVGVAYFPALDEMVSAASGLGCFLNGRRCRVLETDSLARSIVSFTDAGSFEQYDRGREWQRILEASWYRVGWSDAYGHALVASGRLELMLDPVVKPWDCGPFPVILREAGGYFGDWSGNETIHAGEAISTTATLLPEVLRVLGSE
jgi:histidinol-phosphatase